MIDLKDVIELHDKVIVATAKYLDALLITKDSTLGKIPYIRTVW